MYATEQRWPDSAFWAARRAWPDAEPPLSAATAPIAVVRRAVVANDRVVRRAVLVTPDHPDGVYQVHGVPVVPLICLVGRTGADASLGWLTDAAQRLQRPPAAVQRALAWVRARDIPLPARVRAARTSRESV